MSKTHFESHKKKKGEGEGKIKQQLAKAAEKDYSAVLVVFLFFAQYGEIKANTVDVYFGLIFGYVSASRTKRENQESN